jgi:poly(3-hydroxybutyrate) depolymerase
LCDSQGNVTEGVDKDAVDCSGRTELRLYRLIGGRHAWYNTPMNVPGQVPFNPDFDATSGIFTDDILWAFFATHAKS